MATITTLVHTISITEGLDEGAVALFARRAREAGFIAQKGRGRNAARMTVTDAANLLIGVNGAQSPPEVADQIARYRELRTTQEYMTYLELVDHPFQSMTADLSFGSALEWLVTRFSPESVADFEQALEGRVDKKDRAKAAKLGIEIPRVHIELEFVRPALSSSIKIMVPYIARNEVHISADETAFSGEHPSTDVRADRRDLVVLTDRTIRAVAAALWRENSG